MAARTEIDTRIALRLDALVANVGDLPEVADDWDDLLDSERVSWSLDWNHLMVDYLPEVDQAYRAGCMTPDQRARYCELLDSLRGVLSILEHLNLARPRLPLHKAQPGSQRVAG